MTDTAIAASLFSWEDAAGNINTLDVDVVMTVSDKRAAKLTDHVVETGAVITDHVVIQPESLSLELIVTQTPIGGPGMQSAQLPINAPGRTLQPATHALNVPPSQFVPGGFLLLSSGLRSVITGLLGNGGAPTSFNGSAVRETSVAVQASVLKVLTPTDFIADAHDTLIDIMNNALLVTVSFKGRLYIDYLLDGIELRRQAGKTGCASFAVTARAFRTVTGTVVQLPDPADFRALPATQAGNKPGKTPNPDPSKKGETLAHQGAASVSKNGLIGAIRKAFTPSQSVN